MFREEWPFCFASNGKTDRRTCEMASTRFGAMRRNANFAARAMRARLGPWLTERR